MNGRTLLVSAFTLVAVPMFGACGSGSAGTAEVSASGSSSGGTSQGGADAGHDSGRPTTGQDGGGSSSSSGGPSASDGGGGGEREAGADSAGGAGDTDGGITTPAIKVAMYLDNWSGSFASWAPKIDFTKMTHLLLAFATVSGTNTWGNSLGDTSDVQAIAAAAHAKNVKVLVSIGGGGGDQSVISAYQSASNIAPLVANLDAMVTAMNLDGVDVDLESPSSMTSSSNYSAFVAQLIATFHPEGKLVTTASAQYIVQGQNPDASILATIKSFDFINDMIYSGSLSDYTNEATWWTGSDVGLPKENLVLGICFEQCGQAPSTSTTGQITKASLGYGGVMGWDFTDSQEATVWPAVIGAL